MFFKNKQHHLVRIPLAHHNFIERVLDIIFFILRIEQVDVGCESFRAHDILQGTSYQYQEAK